MRIQQKIMSETQTRTQQQGQQGQQGQQQGGRKLALAELQTVQWLCSQLLIKNIYNFAKSIYLALRQTMILGWFIVLTEMIVMWWWTFLHLLPWPQFVLNLIHLADTLTVRMLEFTQQRLEWWRDSLGVRFMWLRESVLLWLDKYITIIDGYLLKLQDVLALILTFVITPLRMIYQFFFSTPKRQGGAEGQREGRKQGVVTDPHLTTGHVNEDEDTEDWAEGYLSDASSDSRRLVKNDLQGHIYKRQQTTGTAEGRLREVMYHRVKKELRVMRKNSVRISCSIMNSARQMIEPTILPYAEYFQAFCQKWAKEYEIQEITTPVKEEWTSDKRFPAKVLALARALCVAYLAFLLRLVKGKKSRRTRSMRSESFRRRTHSLTRSSNTLPLGPSALQQSSEPTRSLPLQVPAVSLQQPLLKESEDLDGLQAKDSALGSEENHSDHLDSDHLISPIHEEVESDEALKNKVKGGKDVTQGPQPVSQGGKDSDSSDRKSEDEKVVKGKEKKGVTIMCPKSR